MIDRKFRRLANDLGNDLGEVPATWLSYHKHPGRLGAERMARNCGGTPSEPSRAREVRSFEGRAKLAANPRQRYPEPENVL